MSSAFTEEFQPKFSPLVVNMNRQPKVTRYLKKASNKSKINKMIKGNRNNTVKRSFKELILSETGQDFAFRTLHLYTAPMKREKEVEKKEREHPEETMKMMKLSEI